MRANQISVGISIHALREEGDMTRFQVFLRHFLISIHALREEGDDGSNRTAVEVVAFLSTPSARRATGAGQGALEVLRISIHALREEGDGWPL